MALAVKDGRVGYEGHPAPDARDQLDDPTGL
jgi:hypothetical protein